MDLYNIWFNLKPGVRDTDFCDHLHAYLGHLQAEKKIEGYRIMRQKLGLSAVRLGEFHVLIETTDLAQLERAFSHVASRRGEVEGLHAAVNQQVTDFNAALYRDFPDPVRARGEERF
jgi:hypothetical protein